MSSKKRYQVFVSSTYTDLKEERQRVLQTLMEMDCIPAGMELFPAADEEQFEFIKSVIDDCDYYLLIIGGRYGSVTSEGISYTEKEYDYAVEKGIKVVALIHGDVGNLPHKNVESDVEAQERLDAFKEKVKTGRLVRFWEKAEELPGLVSINLNKTIKMYPAVGWVRASQGDTTELLTQINELQQENKQLREKQKNIPKPSSIDTSILARGDDEFTLTGEYRFSCKDLWEEWSLKTTWNEIFAAIGSDLYKSRSDDSAEEIINSFVKRRLDMAPFYFNLNKDIRDVVKNQFMALGLITVGAYNRVGGGTAIFWKITEQGKILLSQLLAVKKTD